MCQTRVTSSTISAALQATPTPFPCRHHQSGLNYSWWPFLPNLGRNYRCLRRSPKVGHVLSEK
jgi:hypothetical protein